jgi:hypothetical protein
MRTNTFVWIERGLLCVGLEARPDDAPPDFTARASDLGAVAVGNWLAAAGVSRWAYLDSLLLPEEHGGAPDVDYVRLIEAGKRGDW